MFARAVNKAAVLQQERIPDRQEAGRRYCHKTEVIEVNSFVTGTGSVHYCFRGSNCIIVFMAKIDTTVKHFLISSLIENVSV